MTSTLNTLTTHTSPGHDDVLPHGFSNASLEDLTERERDVLELVTNGYSNAEVSRLLYLSINSVKTYIRTAYRKIGAETRAHAIVWGVRHGLLVDAPEHQDV